MLLAGHAGGLSPASTSYSVCDGKVVMGWGRPGHNGFTDFAGGAAHAASAALAFSAIAWNDAGSWIARSDSTLRSTVMPDLARPSINRL